MSEWPVTVVPFEGRTYKREPIPPGATIELERGQAGPETKGYHFQCPCCGLVYWVLVTPQTEGPSWEADGNEEALTLRPSLLCNNPDGSGGHYWLTDGVLRDC